PPVVIQSVSFLDPTNISIIFSSALDSTITYQLTIANLTDCIGNYSDQTFTFGIPQLAFPGDVVFNELFPDPEPTQGLPLQEFIELYNRSNKTISLENWTIQDPRSQAIIGAVQLAPGGYAIVCTRGYVADYQSFGTVFSVNALPSLNNTGDSLRLIDATGRLIDAVNYLDDWYRDDAKKSGGWTLERIDPNNLCAEDSNWRASINSIGGTPGQPNSVLANLIDSIPPTIPTFSIISPQQIVLNWNEKMDSTSMTNPLNYEISSPTQTPLSVLWLSPKSVEIVLTTPLDSNQLYQLSLFGIRDCSGNQSDTLRTTIAIPVAAQIGDVIINELLFDPRTGGKRYVELYNRSPRIISLKNWRWARLNPSNDSLMSIVTILDDYILYPGNYVCLTSDTQNVKSVYNPIPEARFYQTKSVPTFASNKDVCVILQGNDRIDRFDYLDDYHFADLDSKDGVSLERISFYAPTNLPDNWQSAASTVNYGTPGYKNSQQVNSTAQGPVKVEPPVISPNSDGLDDFATIHYQFDTPGGNAKISIFDSEGRFVKLLKNHTLLGTETGFFTWDGTNDAGQTVLTGVYVVLFEVTYPDNGSSKAFKLPVVVTKKF
ncbi:MAG: lamin tail domain-containing protein, partial [Bacteroidia bacterium]|nr:lamin tail domain-containing protein [Bacteroidia bacterium]